MGSSRASSSSRATRDATVVTTLGSTPSAWATAADGDAGLVDQAPDGPLLGTQAGDGDAQGVGAETGAAVGVDRPATGRGRLPALVPADLVAAGDPHVVGEEDDGVGRALAPGPVGPDVGRHQGAVDVVTAQHEVGQPPALGVDPLEEGGPGLVAALAGGGQHPVGGGVHPIAGWPRGRGRAATPGAPGSTAEAGSKGPRCRVRRRSTVAWPRGSHIGDGSPRMRWLIPAVVGKTPARMLSRRTRTLAAPWAVAALLLVASACSGDDGDTTATEGSAGSSTRAGRGDLGGDLDHRGGDHHRVDDAPPPTATTTTTTTAPARSRPSGLQPGSEGPRTRPSRRS